MTVTATRAWDTRRFRAMMMQTLPSLPNAACYDSPYPDLWHPERPNRRQEMSAIKICRSCPVQAECLAYAQRANPVTGIWGGTTLEMREFAVREKLVIY